MVIYLGCMNGEQAKIDENAVPKFCKARSIPYVLKQKVETEIERLVSMDVLEPVEVLDWATPIVPAKKPDDTVWLFGDYKITIKIVFPYQNCRCVSVEMSACVMFAKLNLRHVYQQMEVEEASRNYLTLNTHKALYHPTRLSLGVKSATGIFPRAIERCLQWLPNTSCLIF